MMENRPSCCRWVTTNQDEFQNPACVRVNRNIDLAEFARYDSCMERQAACEEQLRQNARETLCSSEQEMNREPVLYPTDSHIDEGAKRKPPWCRCLATGDPNCYEENQAERETDQLCCCKKLYNQMEPTPDNNRQKTYSSTYFIDYRDPDYNYIASKTNNKEKLDTMFRDYKAKADAEDLKKSRRLCLQRPLRKTALLLTVLVSMNPFLRKSEIQAGNQMKDGGGTNLQIVLKIL